MDLKIRPPPPFDLLWVAIRGWSKDNVPRLGASLAYYTLFAVAPIIVISIAIAGLVFGPEAVRGELVGQMEGLIGVDGARAIQSLLQSVQRSGDGDLAFTVGTLTFVVAATGAFMELQHALNTVFRVKTRPGAGIKRLILKRLKSLGMVVSLGFLLMVSLVVSAALSALSGWLTRYADQVPVVWQVVNCRALG